MQKCIVGLERLDEPVGVCNLVIHSRDRVRGASNDHGAQFADRAMQPNALGDDRIVILQQAGSRIENIVVTMRLAHGDGPQGLLRLEVIRLARPKAT